MSGTNPVGSWALPLSTGPGVQDPTTYKGNLDADMAVAQRVADAFAPKPASPAAMTVLVDAGFVVAAQPSGGQTITEMAQQSVTIAAAPASPNNRIDLVVVDAGTGAASVIAGTPASSPAAPALPAGKKQVAQIAVPNGTAAIGASAITDLRTVWHGNIPGLPWAMAGGSADAIAASYAPANAALVDGLLLAFRAGAANATATPSFNADALGAKTITKQGGQALVAGDIAGAGAECLLRYNAAGGHWELLNPKAVPPPVTSVAGKTGAVTLVAADISGTAWTQSTLTNNNQLANGSNFAVRGEGVSEFANNAGYITSPVVGPGAVGAYTASAVNPGGGGAIGEFGGTWRNMLSGGMTIGYSTCVANGYLVQRIA